MAEYGGETAEVNARIVYWGVEGSGKTTNLRVIHSKLRPDHRGDLRQVPTRLDPTITYEVLPIELGQIGGVRTRIQIVAAPSGDEQAPTRKQLLDRVDGVVFVVDTARDRIDENLACFEELRGDLAAYGRAVEDVPLVIQYNKRDQGEPYAMEELHRKLSMSGVAAFEAAAAEGTAVLQTLTTISKRVIRQRRDTPDVLAPPEPAAPPAPGLEPDAAAPPAPDLEPEAEVLPAPDLEAEALPAPDLEPCDGADEPGPERDDCEAAPSPAVTQIFDLGRDGSLAETTAEPDSAPGLEPELLAGDDDLAETTARAQSLFEGSFRHATTGDSNEGERAFTIESVGEARQTGERAVQVPLVVRDGETRRRLCLTLNLDPEADTEG